MATVNRNIISLTALLFLVVGTFSIVMVIFSEKDIISQLEYIEYYQIGGALANAVLVIFLVYLTATSTQKSLGYKTVITFILIIGLVSELVMVNVDIRAEYSDYGKYALVVFNFLFRSYHLIGYIQEPWAELTFEAVNKGIKTVTGPITSSAPAASSEDPKKSAFISKWNDYKNAVKLKYPGDIEYGNTDSIKNQAISSGDFTSAKLSELASGLKRKSGEAIAGIDVPTMGGRRRHR